MKAPSKFIKVRQGVTTVVYSLYGLNTTLAVQVSHRDVKPVIFRTLGRKFDFSKKI